MARAVLACELAAEEISKKSHENKSLIPISSPEEISKMRPNSEMASMDHEVAKLRSEVERLRAALKPFADYADKHNSVLGQTIITGGSPLAKRQLTMGNCYDARRALEGK
jgi:hypothetical protein